MDVTDTSIRYEPIGVIRTEYTAAKELPKQAASAESATGRVELLDEYAAGVKDLDGFSHIVLLYHLHQKDDEVPLLIEPFPDDVEHGLFATRSPRRPNPIGLSVVKLDEIAGAILTFDGVDMLDRTPLLDIKPFVPTLDTREECTTGWLEDE